MRFFPWLWHRLSRELSIRSKFLVVNLLALAVTAIVSVVILIQVRRAMTVNAVQSERMIITQTANTLEGTTETIRTVMSTVATMPFLSRVSSTEEVEEFLGRTQTAIFARDFFQTVQALERQSNATAIRIYVNDDLQAVCDHYSFTDVFAPVSLIRSSYWYGIFAGQPGRSSLFCPSFYLTNREKDTLGDLAYVQKIMAFGVSDAEPAGADADGAANALKYANMYIAVYFDSSRIGQILQENRHGNGSVYYLVNSRDNLVLASDEGLAGLYHMDYAGIPEAVDSRTDFRQISVLGSEVYMAYRDITGTDWRLVCCIPADSIFRKEQRLFTRIIEIYLAVILTVLAFHLILSDSMTKRLSYATQHIGVRQDGQLKKLPENEKSSDEIGRLMEAYNMAAMENVRLLKEQEETKDRLQLSEARALQAQINPHFLYNMLDMINWLNVSGRSEEASRAIQSLSRFYKLALAGGKFMTTLADELQQLEAYVALQNMRFGDRIRFYIDVPDALMDCTLPSLVLQPIVENAILHGINEKESKEGDVVLMAWEETDPGTHMTDLVITVSDNGVGIPEERLNQILDGGPPQAGSGTNIAICNTHLRLQLLYGPSRGLSFRSVPGEGTEVEVRVPKMY